jgi:hypothetical protein
MTYAVADLAEHFTSGTAEEPIFFHKTFARSANVL